MYYLLFTFKIIRYKTWTYNFFWRYLIFRINLIFTLILWKFINFYFKYIAYIRFALNLLILFISMKSNVVIEKKNVSLSFEVTRLKESLIRSPLLSTYDKFFHFEKTLPYIHYNFFTISFISLYPIISIPKCSHIAFSFFFSSYNFIYVFYFLLLHRTTK